MNCVQFLTLAIILTLAQGSLSATAAHKHGPSMPHVQFSQISSAVDGEEIVLAPREAQRIERFLAQVFPVRSMKHCARASEAPITRRAVYAMISQQGKRFVLVGFTGRWKEPINVLAIYRMEDGMPNQVWRSEPWEANYYGLHFWTAKVGGRNIVLFQEGGTPGEFGLASVFSFQNAERGLYIHDLTPTLPMLRAYTRFPFRPLFGEEISLQIEGAAHEAQNILLTASDEEYRVNLENTVRPVATWKYNRARVRFERMRGSSAANMTTTVR